MARLFECHFFNWNKLQFDVADRLTAAFHETAVSTLCSQYFSCEIQSDPTERVSVEPFCNHLIVPRPFLPCSCPCLFNTQSMMNISKHLFYRKKNILPANDLVRCGHTLENHTPMSWANIPLVVWVPYSYVITTNHRKHVIFKQVLQGYKALGNSGQFLSHDNCSYFAWKKWLADWLLHCRTRWHVYLVFFTRLF